MYNDRGYVNEERYAVRPGVVRSGMESTYVLPVLTHPWIFMTVTSLSFALFQKTTV